jgi:diaminopimelate epimerase
LKIPFAKMHGAGNDFVVFDATKGSLDLSPERIRRLADRQRGVGCDQVLVVEAADRPDIDFVYRIFNRDGGEVEQCGNGARAFVRFVIDHGLTNKTTIRVATKSGIIAPHLLPDGNVEVDMGAPRFAPNEIPFDASGLVKTAQGNTARYRLEVVGKTLEVAVCSMGNPHAVIDVSDVDRAAVESIGAALERSSRFPERVNVGFAQRLDAHHLRLRVYERGAGETLACGTGACAAAAVGIADGDLISPVTVETRGGLLVIAWDGQLEHPVFLRGPAVTVFESEIDLAQLDEPQ